MYINGFVAAVPTANKDAYRRHAEACWVVFKEHGAVHTVECWGDDVPEGKLTSFPMAVKCQPDETVVFAWIAWPDKATAETGWQAIMADPRMAPDQNPMPFDGKRMIFGGFTTLLDLA